MSSIINEEYWNYRGDESYHYKGEIFYTVTPIPFTSIDLLDKI